MPEENYSEEIKVRLTPTQLKALERFARNEQSKPATEARVAIHKLLLREDDEYKTAFEQEIAVASAKKKKPAKPLRSRLTDKAWVSLSILGNIPAGWPDDRADAKPKRVARVKAGEFPDGSFGLEVTGESMNKARGKFGPILDGETVVLLPADLREAKHGDIVAALVDGQSTLKRLDCRGRKECVLRAESDSPTWKNCIKPARELVIQGVVVGKL